MATALVQPRRVHHASRMLPLPPARPMRQAQPIRPERPYPTQVIEGDYLVGFSHSDVAVVNGQTFDATRWSLAHRASGERFEVLCLEIAGCAFGFAVESCDCAYHRKTGYTCAHMAAVKKVRRGCIDWRRFLAGKPTSGEIAARIDVKGW